MILWLWIACVRRGQVPDAPVTATVGQIDVAGSIVGPTRWTEGVPGGLCWDIPVGWTGRVDGGVSLTDETGIQATLATATWPGPAASDPPGATRVYEDAESWRRVPVLFPASTSSWRTAQPRGPWIQRYEGRIGDRAVLVQLSFPPGTLLRHDRVDPLLAGLCREGG